MAQYHNSLSSHVDKLQTLYQKAAPYLSNIYEAMYQSDEAFAA